MDLALITAQQVAELFILMGLGALGAKTGLLRPEGKQTLSNLLVNLVVPAMIINSYRMDFSPEILRNLLAAFALSILSSLLGAGYTLAEIEAAWHVMAGKLASDEKAAEVAASATEPQAPALLEKLEKLETKPRQRQRAEKEKRRA